MRVEPKLKLRAITALLIVGIIVNGLSLFLFNSIEGVIHGKLYEYGLHFSLDWATPVWNNSHYLVYSLILAVILLGISVPLILVYSRNRSKLVKSFSYLLMMAAAAIGFLSIYFFNNIDSLVNYTLYDYGLQFNNAWAQIYWTYARAIIIFISASSSTALISFLLTLYGARKRNAEVTAIKLVSPILVAIAVVAIAFSIILTNSILAFIGIGLFFWGLIFVYVRTDDYVKRAIMDSMISSQKLILDQFLKQSSFTGKPIYLPPKYFKDAETSKVYIPRDTGSPLPPLEFVKKQESQLFITSPSGILLTPSGIGLLKLFEEQLETSFTKVNLQYLQQELPALLIENLEIVQNFEMQIENRKITIELTNSIYTSSSATPEHLKTEPEKENPITSAIACSLTKATGQPIRIEKTQIGTNNHDFTVEFSILDDVVTSS